MPKVQVGGQFVAQAKAKVDVGGVGAAAGSRSSRKGGGVGGRVVVGRLAVAVQVIADNVQPVQAVNSISPSAAFPIGWIGWFGICPPSRCQPGLAGIQAFPSGVFNGRRQVLERP